MAEGPRCVAWCFGDERRGHENQIRGLLAALTRRLVLTAHWLPPLRRGQALLALLTGHYPATTPLTRPDILIGAGHGTHLSLLAARRACGGRTIVLMRPSLPLSWFDLCVIPEHDRPPRRRNVLVTRGVLNLLTAEGRHDPHRGLILVGGPSRHHAWDQDRVLGQLRVICEAAGDTDWVLSTSRRTPAGFLNSVRRAHLLNLKAVSHADTSPDWLPARLAESGTVWVSEDSVSMVFEAVSSGAACGLLELPRRREADRVTRGVDGLVRDGYVTRFSDWAPGCPLQRPAEPLDETSRVAGEIVERWFSN